MAISRERAQRHIEEFSDKFRLNRRIANWPRHLFFAAHIGPACAILNSGQLVPRAMQRELIHDVANPGAVANNPEAHRFTRLYFRPRNPYHIRTEGIKCLGDHYRQDKQMSIPIMLIFDAESVLSHKGVGFTVGNFATTCTAPRFDEGYFDEIPFDVLYPDGPLPQDRIQQVHYHRMAEVVYPGRLPIEPFLRQIICRTPYDRESLLTQLGPAASRFDELVRVEQIHGSVFMHWGLYIQRLTFHKGTLYFKIKFPQTPPSSGSFVVVVHQFRGNTLLAERREHMPANSDTFCVTGFAAATDSRWEILLEDVIAFCGRLPSDESELV